MSTFRQYTRDDSFTVFANVQQTIPTLTEFQIALAFARDYDENGSTNGKFKPYWDTEKVTADSIIQFKKQNPNLNNVNVFISIGDRDAKYPFKPTDKVSWVSNATNSIESIIKDYFQPLQGIVGIGIGIDVYYEDVDDEAEFSFCVGQLIDKLKNAKAISLASIAPSDKLQQQYSKLYQEYGDSIDFVDYQFYNEEEPIPNPASLIERYVSKVSEYYPKEKLLIGYSSVRKDWAKIAPIVFFIGGTMIVVSMLSPGASIWDIE